MATVKERWTTSSQSSGEQAFVNQFGATGIAGLTSRIIHNDRNSVNLPTQDLNVGDIKVIPFTVEMAIALETCSRLFCFLTTTK